MNNYDLTALARPKARVAWVALPLIEPPAGLERAYLAELRKIEQEMARLLRETVLPSFRAELVRDAEEGIWELVSRLMASFTRGTVEKVKELLGLEGQRHTDQWKASVKKALGIDLAAVVKKDDVSTYLDRATLRSAGLVKDFTDTMVKKLQYETTQTLINGGSARQLQERLKDVLGVTDRRAKIIARDQTAKFNSDLNRIRHQQAGLDEYRWRTSKDERVRERHRKLEGKLYKYSEKTDAEEGLPPGQPILCRCGAQAIVNFAAEAAFKAEEVKPAPAPVPEKPAEFAKAERFERGSGAIPPGSEVMEHPFARTTFDRSPSTRLSPSYQDAFEGKFNQKVEVPVDSLIAWQATIDPKKLKPLPDKYPLPRVAQIDGQLVVIDGNHRSVSAWVEGLTHIKADFVNFDADETKKWVKTKYRRKEPLDDNVMIKKGTF